MKKLSLQVNNDLQEIVYVPYSVSEIDIVSQENTHCSVILVLKKISILSIVVIPAQKSCIKVTIITQLFENEESSITTKQLHSTSESTSSCTVKAVLFDATQLIYKGNIFIDKNARFAHAQQQSKCLLIGTKARAYTAPHLEIETHEVQCTHGSAISTLNEDHLMLCAGRAIEYQQAQQLIIEGFLKEELRSCSTNEQDKIISYLSK
jgi:Fe-S cluster assembly scaffold protein SufB